MAGEIQRYTTVAIILHWLIALLIIGQIACGVYMTRLPDDTVSKFEIYQLHKSSGLSILTLSLLRLIWRITHQPPPLPNGMSGWEKTSARLSHVGFYALMIMVPLGGWALVSASPFASSVPTYIFGVIPWPHLPFFEDIEDRAALTEKIAGLHEFFAFTILGLLALHITAALKHHFVTKDSVLVRMAPIFRQRS